MAHFSRSETEKMERAAALFRVLGQSRRLAILRLLDFGPLPTKAIATQLGQPFKDINYDLGQLSDAEAVGRRGVRGGEWLITDSGRAMLAAYTLLAHVQPRPRLESVTTPQED